MVEKESMIDKIKRLMYKRENIRNIGIVAHVDHGKTTTSDSLLAGAGMISYETAGQQLALDYLNVEKERGITVQNADVNMVHEYEGDEYLINLIDTPGHVDFGGHVTRAMRVIDGAVVICDAVEGVMPQTETVLRQALREKVKPVLFINKVDRLIKELKLGPEEMQKQLIKIISGVNTLIKKMAPEEYKEEWQVNVQDGTVAFGSAVDKWALSFPFMKRTGLTFKDVIDAYNNDKLDGLRDKAKLHVVLLDMIVKHLPSPIEAQKYRVPKIWRGDLESDVGKSLVACDPNGPTVLVVSRVMVDPQAGEITTARIFSGTVERGQDVYLLGAKRQTKIQQLYLFKGAQRFVIDKVPAGNLLGVSGLKDATSGETVTTVPDMEPFEQIKHIFEPVVTKAFEAKSSKDLKKLVDALSAISKEDPTIRVEIDRESGQNLVSGLGELHLEIIQNQLKEKYGLDVDTSPPIVIYRETITRQSPTVMGKSPNKHNHLFFVMAPLPDKIRDAILKGDIPEGRIKKKDDKLIELLMKHGFSREEAKSVKVIKNGNIFMEQTRGIVHIGEIMEYLMQGFEQTIEEGPLAKEPITGIQFVLVDAKLHEDAIHRGPAQIIPALREALREAFMQADPTILEPVQKIRIDVPMEYMGAVSKLIQGRRGQMISTDQEGDEHLVIIAKLPVAEMFGLTAELRGATAGRGVWSLIDSHFEKVPKSLESEIIKKIRLRKGLDNT
ncbi:elongation factor EF-2 [Nanoarchaeota archaeon]|nr:MAG: elongation factor EF-2 [Nanoarchaeota archaeon]